MAKETTTKNPNNGHTQRQKKIKDKETHTATTMRK